MTASGTYSFAMSNADVVLSAYSRIQVRRTAMLAEHLRDAYREANLAFVKFANAQPNLWTSEQQTVDLVDGTATYSLPARSVMILSAFIRTGSGASQNDRLIYPVSEYEYASYPNKAAEGFPSVFWFDRQITPQITFWLVPDASSTYTAYLQIVRQIQDANLASGETPDIPYRWYDAFVAELAHRLSRIWKPEQEALRKQDAAEAWALAATQDTENVNLNIIPSLQGYFS